MLMSIFVLWREENNLTAWSFLCCLFWSHLEQTSLAFKHCIAKIYYRENIIHYTFFEDSAHIVEGNSEGYCDLLGFQKACFGGFPNIWKE